MIVPVVSKQPSGSSKGEPAQQEQQNPCEWDAFWSAVECCMALQSGDNTPLHASGDDRSGKRARTARCGSCAGCVRGDCGECKNCLDKPKFGGRGIKKQACVRRACCNPQPDDDSDSEQTQSTARGGGFLSADVSPAILPKEGLNISPLALDGAASGPSSMLLQARRMLEHARSLTGEDSPASDVNESMGYSTADEEQHEATSNAANASPQVPCAATPRLPSCNARHRRCVPTPPPTTRASQVSYPDECAACDIEPLGISQVLVLACERS